MRHTLFVKSLNIAICLALVALLGSVLAGCGIRDTVQDLTPLAEQGDADAQYNLGEMYYFGTGVPQDYQTALEWFKLAAEQGHADAQYILGVLYHNGEGVLQDYKVALKWLKLAAEQGHATAQYILGSVYINGESVPQDYKTALKWYKLAAAQGNAGAQLNLGVMYYHANGTPQDYLYAHMWLNIAASSGSQDISKKASKNRNDIAEFMSSDDISKAQKLARECVAKKYVGCE